MPLPHVQPVTRSRSSIYRARHTPRARAAACLPGRRAVPSRQGSTPGTSHRTSAQPSSTEMRQRLQLPTGLRTQVPLHPQCCPRAQRVRIRAPRGRSGRWGSNLRPARATTSVASEPGTRCRHAPLAPSSHRCLGYPCTPQTTRDRPRATQTRSPSREHPRKPIPCACSWVLEECACQVLSSHSGPSKTSQSPSRGSRSCILEPKERNFLSLALQH
mmetsp:Transcript_81323/g.225127  ORF Transcript_81323/g.225127 Transcript_81323/m.225127 type:complete len:216 (-) Transcript_81323:993-1640(-)